MHIRPPGGNRLGADTLKPAQHPVSRPKKGLDAQYLLAKGSGGVGGDLRAVRPPPFTISLDGLVGGIRVAREEVCQERKAKSQIRD